MGSVEKLLERADVLKFRPGPVAVEEGSLYAYNVELNEWSRVSVHVPVINSLSWQYYILIRHIGRILVASVLLQDREAEYIGLEGFVVFELHSHAKPESPNHNIAAVHQIKRFGADWVEIARTPWSLWEGNPIVDQESKYIAPPLVYDLERDSWYHLPPLRESYDVPAIVVMQPSGCCWLWRFTIHTLSLMLPNILT
ncbi:hypothetical protein L7F22_020420 [Adiantum nelumboides]|nr:hypothetical protein [Adiantum nelumboides]